MVPSLDRCLGSTIQWDYPQYRSRLLDEVQAVENLSAILALGAAGMATAETAIEPRLRLPGLAADADGMGLAG